MNAIEVLKQDHELVQQLFSEYISAEDDDFVRREELFQQIEKALLAHSDAEEQIFYPALQSDNPDLIQEAISEHLEVKQLLAEMLEFEVDDEEFENRINLLMQKVQEHVAEEEGPNGTFDMARQKLDGSALEEMGRRIQQKKKDSEEELAA